MNLGLKFQRKSEEIEYFVHASQDKNDSEGKFTSGLILFLFGDAIFWESKKQMHVSLSSTEAEYIAMSLAAKELVYIREMCRRLLKIEKIPIMYEDNTAAIYITKSDDSQSLKHIVSLCFHYVKLEVANKNLIVKRLPTSEQTASILTKALDRYKLEKFQVNYLTI